MNKFGAAVSNAWKQNTVLFFGSNCSHHVAHEVFVCSVRMHTCMYVCTCIVRSGYIYIWYFWARLLQIMCSLHRIRSYSDFIIINNYTISVILPQAQRMN